MPGPRPDTPIEQVFRAEWSRVLAALVGFCRDIHVAEDAAQEAFTVAARKWARDGAPDDPRAWLVTTGRRRALDRLRGERAQSEKARRLRRLSPEQVTGPTESPVDPTTIPDERLELVFMCCHPALAVEARVALTLRALAGLTADEIARAFLVGEETMKRRLTRARTKIQAAGIPFTLPGPDALPARVDAVLAVLYLVFNQGYGDGRVDLAAEAIRMARTLRELLPDEPRTAALLALMLLHDSRRAAREQAGELVPLAEQDRRWWNRAQITEGGELLEVALGLGARGPYAVQAAIAALQTEDPVDWAQVAALYRTLGELTGSPVVELNRAVAVAELAGPEAALALVDRLDLGDYRYLHSTRAELLRRIGAADEARAAYRRALELTTTEPERRFLRRRLTEL